MTENRPLRALIVDDEPTARAFLRRLLEQESGVEVCGECGDGEEAASWLGTNQADVVFLDIRMPRLDGFQMLGRLDRESLPAIVFVTAYDEFALRAFEVEAWDYLLKPFDAERLRQTLARVRERRKREAPGEVAEQLAPLLERLAEDARPMTRIAVPDGRGRVTIDLADVEWIEAESNYARFHLQGKSYLARIALSKLEAKLDPRRFVRIHRSAIVNVERVERLVPCGHGDLTLSLAGGQQLSLSRRYRARLEKVLESFS